MLTELALVRVERGLNSAEINSTRDMGLRECPVPRGARPVVSPH